MRSSEFINEIERIPASAYSGGKSYLSPGQREKVYKKLPGGSGLLYSIEHPQTPSIKLWDPTTAQPDPKPRRDPYEFAGEFRQRLAQWEKRQAAGTVIPTLVGKLELEEKYGFPLKGAFQVGTITVDEDYRGVGIAKALYGIVLTIMKRPLVAGDSQTPGGRRNWVSLASIPGVQMKGYVSISDDDLDANPEYAGTYNANQAAKNIDTIMGKLGGQYMGSSPRGGNHYFAFDVQPNATGKELEGFIKTNLSRVYHGDYDMDSGLYAVWTGK